MSEPFRPDPDAAAPAAHGIEHAEAPITTCTACASEYQGGDACPLCGVLDVDVACQLHPDRGAEGRCVVCGRAVCDECRAGDGHAALCTEHRTVPVIEGWAQVYTTTTELDAQLVRENLQAEGIDSQIYSQRDSAFIVDLGELSIVRVLVPVWEYGSAVQLIRERIQPDGDVAFACPACGDVYEAGARQCAACGEALG